MAEKVYFGVPGNIQEIPAPKTGMGFDSNTDTEVTDLVSGGRSVYRAPTSYKTFNLTWASNSDRLRHLIDMYNGQFGPGPFYFTDPTVSQENVLPARWSNAWQLAHQSNGWCRPVIDTDDGIPTTPMPSVYRTNRYVTFKQATAGTVKTEGVVRTRLIRVPGKGYFLSVAGAATGGAAIKVRGFSSATNTWTTLSTFTTFTGATVNVLSDSNNNITMLELDLYLPLGSTLTLKGMALGTVDHSAILNVLRTNHIQNGSFENGLTGWSIVGGTATATTGLAQMIQNGTKHIQVTSDGTSATPGYNNTAGANRIPSVAGEWVAARGFVATEAVNYETRMQLIFYTAAGASLGGATSPWVATPFYTGGWPVLSGLAPATTATVAVLFQFRDGNNTAALVPAGKRMWSDAIMMVKGTTEAAALAQLEGGYFDGATADNNDTDRYYRWTGTAYASTSVETDQIPTDWMPVGQGVGALQFGDSTGGTLVSSTIDRIGLSLDFTEVQNVESLML